MNSYADLPPYRPSPWLFGQSGCGHFIKSPRIIYRLAHRIGGLPRPPFPPASRGSLAVFAADARIYLFGGGGGRAVIVRLFIIVRAAGGAVRVRPLAPRL